MSGTIGITEYSPRVICPHCNVEELDEARRDWDYIDGETHQLNCSNCGKVFWVMVDRPIEYACSKEEL